MFLRENVLEEWTRGSGSGLEVDLCEKTDNVDMTVTITDLWEDSVVLNMEHVAHLGCVRDGKWHQKCDFLIFATTNRKSTVILLELKQTVGEGKKPYEQLLRTRPIVDYLVSMASTDTPSASAIRFHHVLVGAKASDRLDKQRVKSGPPAPVCERTFQGTRTIVFLDRRIRAADLLR